MQACNAEACPEGAPEAAAPRLPPQVMDQIIAKVGLRDNTSSVCPTEWTCVVRGDLTSCYS